MTELVVTVSVFDDAGREVACARLRPWLMDVLRAVAAGGPTAVEQFEAWSGGPFPAGVLAAPEAPAQPAEPESPAPAPTEPEQPAAPEAPVSPAEPEQPAAASSNGALAPGTKLRVNVLGSPLHGHVVEVVKELAPGSYACQVLEGPCAGESTNVDAGQYQAVAG